MKYVQYIQSHKKIPFIQDIKSLMVWWFQVSFYCVSIYVNILFRVFLNTKCLNTKNIWTNNTRDVFFFCISVKKVKRTYICTYVKCIWYWYPLEKIYYRCTLQHITMYKYTSIYIQYIRLYKNSSLLYKLLLFSCKVFDEITLLCIYIRKHFVLGR